MTRATYDHKTKPIIVAIAIAVVGPLVAAAAVLIATGSWASLWLLYVYFLTWGLPVWLIGGRRKKLGIEHAPAELSRALTDRDRALRSAVASAVRDAITPRFVTPRSDVVLLGDGASLSSRLQPAQRTATHSRSEIESHLTRSGGAAIGVTGERGVGKSETLRHFCDDPEPRPTPESGGTIGVFVAVPSAFDAREFLMLIARRLAEAVPGRVSSSERRRRRHARRGWTIGVLGVAVLVVGTLGGLGLFDEFRWTAHHTFTAVGSIGAVAYMFGLIEVSNTFRSRRLSVSGLRATSTGDVNTLPTGRKLVIAQADDLIRRIRYAETIKSSNEGSASWGKFGWKSARERSLSEVPLTEADLVAEFTELANSLHLCGYRVIVGVDEMDKLESGEKAERFLNSVKMLFPARSCSFLVSVSTSAWSTFVRRGVDVRGALDSSLDEIETVRPMDFLESRSLVRHRGEQMSDSQILLCHVLGGGLPHEVLRSARLLSGIVRLRTGDQTLADAGPSLIDAHLAVLVEGMEPQLGAFNRDVAAVVRARIEHLDRTWSDSSRARDALRSAVRAR